MSWAVLKRNFKSSYKIYPIVNIRFTKKFLASGSKYLLPSTKRNLLFLKILVPEFMLQESMLGYAKYKIFVVPEFMLQESMLGYAKIAKKRFFLVATIK